MRQIQYAGQGPATEHVSAFGYDLSGVVNGYLLSAALFAAVELDIFNPLSAQPMTVEELADHTRVSWGLLNRLIRVLYALDLLVRLEDGRIALTNTTEEALVDGTSTSMLPAIRHHHRHAYTAVGNLADSMREGRPSCDPDGNDLYALLERNGDFETFIAAMDSFSKGIGARITQLVDLSHAHAILDLGGGGGQIAHELLDALPEVRIMLAEQPPVLNYAQARFGQEYDDRLSLVAHDFRRDTLEPESADVVLLSAVLGDWDAHWRSVIFRHAWTATRPGGILLVSETMLDGDERGPPAALVLSLYVLAITQGGDNFTEAEWREFLEAEDVRDFDIIRDGHNGFRDLIVCRKPATGQ